jgi:Site-specific recombinase XerC
LISGHISEKRGYLYVILNLRKPNGTRGPKWFSTGLKAKGNKRKAEEILIEMRRQYSSLEISGVDAFKLSVSEYLSVWVLGTKSQIAPSTYESYCQIIFGKLVPYFDNINLMLCALKPFHLDALYQSLLDKGLSPNTVIRYHAVIHKALSDAVRKEILVTNPAALAQRPSKEDFMTIPYSADEIQQLFDSIKGHKLELLIKLTAFYGLRRSEVLGLKWKAVNFEQSTITINHTVHRIHDSGKTTNICRDKVKRKSSYRTLPMPEPIQKAIIVHRDERYAVGRPEPDAYLFLDKRGDVIKPDYVSTAFSKLLHKNGLRHIRLHDLRHSSAGILISNRIPLIEVQQWLGHSTINTTASFYAHLEYAVKEQSAAVMSGQLFKEENHYEELPRENYRSGSYGNPR